MTPASPEVPGFSILPVQYADIDRLAKIGEDAFKSDTHTQVKKLGKAGYDMEEMSKRSFRHNLSNERYVFFKAIYNSTGEIAGSIGAYFMGIDISKIPSSNRIASQDEPAQTSLPSEDKRSTFRDRLTELEDLENKDMKEWQQRLSPPGSKCLIIVGITIDPEFQGRGAGSKLLKCLTDIADELGVYIWVHSSEAAWKTFRKFGFEVQGEFVVDLDEWAPSPPTSIDGDAMKKWGRYVCRYMKRLPVLSGDDV